MHIVLGNGLVVEDVEIQGLPLEAGSNNTASGRVDVGPDLECPALPGDRQRKERNETGKGNRNLDDTGETLRRSTRWRSRRRYRLGHRSPETSYLPK